MSGGFLAISTLETPSEGFEATLAGMLEAVPEADRRRRGAAGRHAWVVWGDAECTRAGGYTVLWKGNAAFRRALGSKSHRWLDLLEQFAQGRLEVFRDLPGQFGLGIIHEETGHVHLVVDRIGGSVPLAHALATGVFVFGTWAPAVAAHPAVQAPVSADAIRCYLYFHVVPTPMTAFENVKKVEGGTVVGWHQGTLEARPYWKPVYRPQSRRSFAALRADFLDRLHRGVEACSSEEPVGSFLSGGTDSSTVVGVLTRLRGSPQEVFCVGFEDDRYDESHYARCAAGHFGANLHSIVLTPSDLLELLEAIPRAFDGPFGNASAAPALACAREARGKGLHHLLAGDGGDELFGGNKRYARQQVLEQYHRIPTLLRRSVIEPALLSADGPRGGLLRKPSAYVHRASRPLPLRLAEYNQLAELGGEEAFTPAFRECLSGESLENVLRRAYARAEADHYLHRIMATDLKITLEDSDLPKVSGTSSAAGIVTDFPFLHPEILDFALCLPPSWLVRRGRLRWFFKEALKDFLPVEVLNKKKHGFGLPFGLWLLRDARLAEVTRRALADLTARGILEPSVIEELLRRHRHEHPSHYGAFVWVLLQLELWLRAHAPDYQIAGARD